MRRLVGLTVAAALLTGALPAAARAAFVPIYRQDFAGAVGPEWSTQSTDVTPSGRRFLGQFGNQTVTLRLPHVPPHAQVRLSFQLFVIRTWDGNGEQGFGPDGFRAAVENGPQLMNTTFANSATAGDTQSYPDDVGASHPLQTGAAAVNSLGYKTGDGTPMDAVYDIVKTFGDTGSTLAIDFAGTGLQELADESWGIGSIEVAIDRPVHYRVELRSWTPQGAVADPAHPFVVPAAFARRCPGVPRAPGATPASSVYAGDGHAAYDGGFAAQPFAEFDWDGSAIANLQTGGGFGAVRRLRSFATSPPTGCTTAARTPTSAVFGGALGGNRLQLGLQAPNPLVPAARWPAADATVVGAVGADGTLTVSYQADDFPSAGVRVLRDGVPLATRTAVDASCLAPGTLAGRRGAALAAWGRSRKDVSGTLTVPLSDVSAADAVPSPLCGAHLWVLDAAAAAHLHVSVAPIAGGKPSRYRSLATARREGLVAAVSASRGVALVGDPARPVAVRVRGRRAVLTTAQLAGAALHPIATYGPRSSGLVAFATSALAVTARGGKAAAARAVDATPPRTRTTVRVRGSRAIVTLHARDRSGVVATLAELRGRRLTVRHGRVTVPRRRLRSVRVASIDVFGNVETPHRPG